MLGVTIPYIAIKYATGVSGELLPIAMANIIIDDDTRSPNIDFDGFANGMNL